MDCVYATVATLTGTQFKTSIENCAHKMLEEEKNYFSP